MFDGFLESFGGGAPYSIVAIDGDLCMAQFAWVVVTVMRISDCCFSIESEEAV